MSPAPKGDRAPARRLASIAPEASPLEAAAIVAALEEFARASARAAAPAFPAQAGAWTQAALREGVAREPHILRRDPWINT